MHHRDNRKGWESSSSFGQIMHRRGPRQTTTGDIDHYVLTRYSDMSLLMLVERFQPNSRMKGSGNVGQNAVLQLLDDIIRHCVGCPLFDQPLYDRSGVVVLRGKICGGKRGKRAVDFFGPQTMQRLDGSALFKPNNGDEIFSWLIGNDRWTRYDGKERELRSLEDRADLAKRVALGSQPVKSPLRAIQQLLPLLTIKERLELCRQLGLFSEMAPT
jgi:hypothetical protein